LLQLKLYGRTAVVVAVVIVVAVAVDVFIL